MHHIVFDCRFEALDLVLLEYFCIIISGYKFEIKNVAKIIIIIAIRIIDLKHILEINGTKNTLRKSYCHDLYKTRLAFQYEKR